MIISVMNFKGGVGKSTISFNIAKHFGLKMVTNDKYSALSNIKQTTGGGSINIKDNRLYDFGGFEDKRAAEVLASSDVIVVPTLYSRADIQNTVLSVRYILKASANANIVVVINRVRSGDDKVLNEVKEQLNKHIKHNVQYVTLRDSKAMLRSINEQKTIFDIHKSSGLSRHVYAPLVNDFFMIVSAIEHFGEEVEE
ncbi:MAG: ParA family protein [Campylobacterota bacterium]|nr:ParA family protein [Campylobacterota bacterium]